MFLLVTRQRLVNWTPGKNTSQCHYHRILEVDHRSFQFQISPSTVPSEAAITPTNIAKGSETSISNQPGSSTFITSGGSHIMGARVCAITGGITTAGTA